MGLVLLEIGLWTNERAHITDSGAFTFEHASCIKILPWWGVMVL
jgi:hypothetical protein